MFAIPIPLFASPPAHIPKSAKLFFFRGVDHLLKWIVSKLFAGAHVSIMWIASSLPEPLGPFPWDPSPSAGNRLPLLQIRQKKNVMHLGGTTEMHCLIFCCVFYAASVWKINWWASGLLWKDFDKVWNIFGVTLCQARPKLSHIACKWNPQIVPVDLS